MAKKALLVAVLVVSMVAMMSATALATDPTITANPYTYTEAGALAGASVWTYQDASDASAKTEGSYNAYDDDPSNPRSGATTYSVNPHGGYSTTSNKCKTCHAVHRATGAFALMRVDSADEACNYCHIGSHRHATSEAYFGGSNGIYSSNGHTIGAGQEIPDSSIWQWTESTTVRNGSGETTTVPIRRYLTQKNKLMRYIVHGNRFIRVGPNYLRCASCHQVHNAQRQIWQPLASGYLPDAAGTLIAAGTKLTQGYKLLRNSPSGSIQVSDTDIAILDTGSTAVTGARALSKVNATYYDPGASGQLNGLSSNSVDYRIKAVETTVEPATGLSDTGATIMGPNVTGYTPWKYTAPSNLASELVSAMPVVETSLSFYCADCHNLNIAGKTIRSGFGTGRSGEAMLGDRSHAVPSQTRKATVTDIGTHCTQCHNNDMPLDGTARFKGSDCGACHVTTQMYHYYKNGANDDSGQKWAAADAAGNGPRAKGTAQAARSDFPHSGPDWGKKLLNARDRRIKTNASNNFSTNPTFAADAYGVYDTQGSAIDFGGNFGAAEGQDKVCKTCHGGMKNREIGYDK